MTSTVHEGRPDGWRRKRVGTMKTKHYVFQIFRAAFTDRLVLIIVVLMIASIYAVLPIKSCSNPGASGGGEAAERPAPVSMAG
ncbi:hypothetical protein LAC81_09410 [Ensifer adhaerens]|uniref:hypothetical protein n=1 Tax=Ensifer adhaerens TaxID=106592 RepID=UPI001CC06399|nr:hypothetical protein [Ensifer adhaerens]MBZ7922000.1 hypothetical protein [Ensifer adhaerens]UAX94391.1 hypothetical protein LAC78_09405 [Ensifer adhaerens]UAY02026.1 hypothetical protein LAC80_09415 [Ensifer adhaerens]UAY09409.1 hypothetical protein LAC81_09410 [Ensifer adhaerens]